MGITRAQQAKLAGRKRVENKNLPMIRINEGVGKKSNPGDLCVSEGIGIPGARRRMDKKTRLEFLFETRVATGIVSGQCHNKGANHCRPRHRGLAGAAIGAGRKKGGWRR